MKRILFLGALALWLAGCNANRSGSGGNPSEDSVAPATEGKGYTNDVGNGATKGGSTDPMNGGGPQTIKTGAQGADTSSARRTSGDSSKGQQR